MKYFFKNIILNKILRSSSLQPLWEKLHSYSIVGMNFWGGARFEESGELWIVKNVLKGKINGVIFDIGANEGHYSLSLSNIIGERSKIYCFEPSKKTFEKLKRNVSHIDGIILNNLGFGDKEQKLILYHTSESTGLSSLYGNNPLTEFTEEEEINLSTITGFCNSNRISEIDFLKVDVEGHEYNVLLGATEMIRERRIKFIQFEMGECNIVSRTFFRDFYELLKDNYIIYRVLPDGIREIKHYKTIHEIFACINYLAVARK
ncbi:MAG: FkbM family methyltransferase [Cytophagaceae bacterium]